MNELRARIKSLEQLRPANPSYEKVLQQVVLLKRELAELRAKHALPTDMPFLPTSATNSFYQQSSNSFAQSPTNTNMSDLAPDVQRLVQERTAHAETMNTLQTCDNLVRNFDWDQINSLIVSLSLSLLVQFIYKKTNSIT